MLANQYTKESIKSRMYKQMSLLWGIRSVESVDPIVKLLIEGLASEVFKLAGDMGDIENRLLQKLAMALTPNIALSSSPSHGILHTRSQYGVSEIDSQMRFVHKNAELMKNYDIKEIPFVPLLCVQVVDGDIVSIISNDEYSNVNEMGEKEIISKTVIKSPLMNQKVWLGIEINKEIKELENLCIYIDFPYVEERNSYLSLLPFCRCRVGEKEIRILQGMGEGKAKNFILDKYNINYQIMEKIKDKYNSHFIILQEKIKLKEIEKKTLPEELSGLFPEAFMKEKKDSLLWISIEFPPHFSNEILSQIKAMINTFVIVNKYDSTIEKEVNVSSTIIPLSKTKGEYLISLENVTDSSGRGYREIHTYLDKEIAEDIGSYALRRGGSERFNALNANEYIMRLMDLLYDESVSFADIGADSVKEVIEDLQDQIGLLEDKRQDTKIVVEMLSYIMLENNNIEPTRITAKYILTNGELANGLSAIDKLESTSIAGIDARYTCLITTTLGGKPSPSVSRTMDMYRYLLLSHDNIYSKEDIKNFCMANYGDYISKVEVSLGYEVSHKPDEGFIRILNVRIFPSKEFESIDRENFLRDIYNDLKKHSPDTFNYKIMIEKI